MTLHGRRIYALNVSSLIPWNISRRGPELSIHMALQAGFDGIHFMPLRFWSYSNVSTWEKYVLSYGDPEDYYPGFVEAVSFWRPVSRFFSGARLIYYNRSLEVESRRSIGIHTLSANIVPYITRCDDPSSFQGHSFCWDTQVLDYLPDGSFGKEWHKLFRALPSGSVSVINVNLTKGDIVTLLKRSRGALMYMLSQLGRKFTQAQVHLQVSPYWLGSKGALNNVRALLEVLKDYFG